MDKLPINPDRSPANRESSEASPVNLPTAVDLDLRTCPKEIDRSQITENPTKEFCDPRLIGRGAIKVTGLSRRHNYSEFLAQVNLKVDSNMAGAIEQSNILVTNIPYSVTKEQLKLRFSEFGEIKAVGFPKCPHTCSTFGVAFVLYGKGVMKDSASAKMATKAANSTIPIVMDGATLTVRLDVRRAYIIEQIEIQKARAIEHLARLLTRQPAYPLSTESGPSRPMASAIFSSPRPRAAPLHRVTASPRTAVKQPREADHLDPLRSAKCSRLDNGLEGRDSYGSPHKPRLSQESDSPTQPKALHWPNDPFPYPDFKPPTFIEESIQQVDHCVTVESRYLPLLIADEAAMLGHLRQFGAREVFKERRCWVIVFDNRMLAENCLRNANAMSYQGYTMIGKVQALSEFRKLEESVPSVPLLPLTDLKPRTLPSTGLPSFKRITNRMRPQPAPTSPPPQPRPFDSRTPSPYKNHRPTSPGSARRPFEAVDWSPVETESTLEGGPPPHSTGCARTQGYYPTDRLKPFRQAFTVGEAGIRRGGQPSKWIPISAAAKQHATYLKESGERVVLARSSIHDWGLFAREPLKKGDLVIEYVGELIRSELADIREFKCFARGIDSSYLFRIDEEFVIDATDSGNVARFINHSCQPNCKAEIECIGGRSHIFIYASEDIPRFQEVTYDYQFPIEEESTKIKCLCNTPVCRGFLN